MRFNEQVHSFHLLFMQELNSACIWRESVVSKTEFAKVDSYDNSYSAMKNMLSNQNDLGSLCNKTM